MQLEFGPTSPAGKPSPLKLERKIYFLFRTQSAVFGSAGWVDSVVGDPSAPALRRWETAAGSVASVGNVRALPRGSTPACGWSVRVFTDGGRAVVRKPLRRIIGEFRRAAGQRRTTHPVRFVFPLFRITWSVPRFRIIILQFNFAIIPDQITIFSKQFDDNLKNSLSRIFKSL